MQASMMHTEYRGLKSIPGIRQELLSRIFDVFMRIMAV